MSEKLKNYLERAKIDYYSGNPSISNEVYDQLESYIEHIEMGHVVDATAISHFARMYSLAKHYPGDRYPDALLAESIVESPKLDGAAIAALYVDGTLVQVLTRGDGKRGKDVTSKFTNSKCSVLPKSIEHAGIIQITGEVLTHKTTPNARNYAAGALNLKSEEEFLERDLTFVAYGVYPCIKDTFSKDMLWLTERGFLTVCDSNFNFDVFPQDGLVHRIDSNKLFEEAGFTSDFPKGAIALKTRDEGIETVLREVIWQTAKTGRVTPVGIFDPIEIDGAVITRATLNNAGFIEALDVDIGDTILVIRAGGIIPCIVGKK